MTTDPGKTTLFTRLAYMVAVAAVALSVVAITPGIDARASSSAAQPVFFVPLGEFSQSEAAALARFVERELGVQTGVLSRSAIPKTAFNRQRKQLVAETLIDVVAGRRTTATDAPVLIGLTVEDMHTRAIPNWRFSFSIRHPSGLAVVSRARMDPRALGLFPDPALRMRRLQKMVVKNVGILSLGLAQSRNPRSALFDVILSTDDLDFMTSHFRPPVPTRLRRAWLRGSTAVCERGVVEAKALIARSQLATQADLLAYAADAIALADKRRRELTTLPVGPEDKRAVQELIARFRRAVDTDRAAVTKLERRWSDAELKRWLRDDLRYSLALKSDALELGSRACARYFDPATYVR